MAGDSPRHPSRSRLVLALILIALAIWFGLLPTMGSVLVNDEPPRQADAVVVLSTGVDYYPRLIEAARLVKQGYAPRVVINGNRKTAVLRELEAMGFVPVAPWDANSRRILNLLGVSEEQILSISAEDAYDTISEARAVGPHLKAKGYKTLLIVTSRFHTRRAGYIWTQELGDSFEIATVAAAKDPFDPQGWWKNGRQIRQLLAEYGGWLFYLLKAITD